MSCANWASANGILLSEQILEIFRFIAILGSRIDHGLHGWEQMGY